MNKSNFEVVKRKAKKYLGDDVIIKKSTRKNKKFMVLDEKNKWIHFGDDRYQDYTKHKDKNRRERYLKRATKIKGNWKNDKYSPNNLSINLLW